MHEIEEEYEEKEEKPQGLRRTASFANVQIQEVAESDEEESKADDGKNNGKETSPNDARNKAS